MSDLDKLIDSNGRELLTQKLEDSLKVNAFAQSSNTALDDSSDRLVKVDTEKRNKMYKVQSKINGHSIKKSIVKSGTRSDSESSLDPWFNQEIEMEPGLSNEYTDSDEACQSDDVCDPVAWRQCASNIGESDSITEGPSRFREPRRKRKLKRMTIDPSVELTQESMSDDTSFSLKNKHIRNIKMQKEPKMSSDPEISELSTPQISAAHDSTDELPMALACGKRKRAEEKSADSSSMVPDKFFLEPTRAFTQSCEKFASCMTFDSDSEVTSSESECALSTNDESREADDEQSDFFFESGPSKSGLNSDEDDAENDYGDGDDDEEEDEEQEGTAAYEEKFLCKMLEQTKMGAVPAFHSIRDRFYEERKEQIRKYLEAKHGKVPNSKIGSRIFGNSQPKPEDERIREFIAARRRIRDQRIILSTNDDFMAEDSDKEKCSNFVWSVDNCFTNLSSNEKKKRR